MPLVSASLAITLFAWFPGKEDEDKGVSCLQPQGTCTLDDDYSPRDVQLPRLGGGSLVSSMPTAGTTSPSAPPNPSVTTEEVLGDGRQEGNERKGQSTPYF